MGETVCKPGHHLTGEEAAQLEDFFIEGARYGDVEDVETSLAHGVNVDAQDSQGRTGEPLPRFLCTHLCVHPCSQVRTLARLNSTAHGQCQWARGSSWLSAESWRGEHAALDTQPHNRSMFGPCPNILSCSLFLTNNPLAGLRGPECTRKHTTPLFVLERAWGHCTVAA